MWARIGSLFILSKHLGNASQVWVVGVVRARGGLNTQKMQPGVGSGEAGVVWCGR